MLQSYVFVYLHYRECYKFCHSKSIEATNRTWGETDESIPLKLKIRKIQFLPHGKDCVSARSDVLIAVTMNSTIRHLARYKVAEVSVKLLTINMQTVRSPKRDELLPDYTASYLRRQVPFKPNLLIPAGNTPCQFTCHAKRATQST
jgi:hypothetical protein